MPKPAKLPVIIELGKCPFCHTQIMTLNEKKQPVRAESYREMWILLSDGSRMKLAICSSCRDSVSDEMIAELMTEHQKFWVAGLERAYKQKELDLKKQKEQHVGHFQTLSAVRHAKTERLLDES